MLLRFFTGLGLFGVLVWIALLIGWVLNFFQIVLNIPADWVSFTVLYALKVVGVFFFPLGGLLGLYGLAG